MVDILKTSAHLKTDQPFFKCCSQAPGSFNSLKPEITGLLGVSRKAVKPAVQPAGLWQPAFELTAIAHGPGSIFFDLFQCDLFLYLNVFFVIKSPGCSTIFARTGFNTTYLHNSSRWTSFSTRTALNRPWNTCLLPANRIHGTASYTLLLYRTVFPEIFLGPCLAVQENGLPGIRAFYEKV